MMKRSIRNSLRWSLVVTLATVLSTGPVAAGWLHRHLHSGSDEAVCAPAPTCCEPAPAPFCCPEPVYSPPAMSCCEPAPCCGEEIVNGISPVEDSSQWGKTVLQDSDKSSSDKSSSNGPKLGVDSENPTSTTSPAKTDKKAADDTAKAKGKDAAVVAPPVPMPQPEALPESDAEDLFEDDAPPAMKLPADAQPAVPAPVAPPAVVPAPVAPPAVVPAPVAPPTDESVDDLFGGADEPAMTEPKLDPAPPAAAPAESESIDDLFGAPPVEDNSAPTESESVEDLFGTAPAPSATEPTMPVPDADENAADSDDLFGAPSGFDAAPMEEPSDSVDDLFSDPAAQPKATEPATPAEGSDDLLSEPPADDTNEGALDDLFSQWNGDSDGVESAIEVDAAQESTSADTLTGLDHTKLRTWVDNTGGFRTEGRLVKIGDDFVKLLKNNGKTCTVPRSRLSDEDSDYVQSIVQRVALFVMATPNR